MTKKMQEPANTNAPIARLKDAELDELACGGGMTPKDSREVHVRTTIRELI